LKLNIKIVPVSINFERLFEQSYLAKEAKEGIFNPATNLFSMMQSVLLQPNGQFGKVFVKYSEPIDLN
jgi:glycerol-3-phosphate O-acyltransferase